MNKIAITSHVKNGVLDRNRTELAEAVKQFEGRNIVITVEPKRNKRSDQQNRWYFGVAIELIRLRLLEFGYRYSKEVVHEKVKQWICDAAPDVMLEETVTPDGVVLKGMRSTASLTTTEFMAYKEAVQQWAAENLDLVIPDPNEQLAICD